MRILCGAGLAGALILPAGALEPGPSQAGTAEETETAAEARSAGRADHPTLQKVGEARLRVLLWSIYNSRLYTPTGNYTGSERPVRLEIEYLINVKAADLVDRTAREWEAMGRHHAHEDAWLQRLDHLWPDVGKHDVLTLELDENNVSTFLLNGDRLGHIEDPAFGEQFLDIWLSEDSTRPSLREELIGAASVN